MTRRALLLGLAVLFAGFAAYGSFVPLRLRSIPVADAVATFRSTPLVPFAQASRTDLLTNVLLFVPIGFFLLGAVAWRRKGLTAFLAFPVVAASIALSVAIEFGQVFVAGRTPSWNDVVADSVGACAGAGLWLLAGNRLVSWFTPVLESAAPSERVFRLLAVYTAAWLLMGVVPFDYTLRPQELAEKFREGRIVLQPFAPGTSIADVLSTWFMAMPVGVFCALAALHFEVTAPKLVAVVSGLCAVIGLEFAQVLAVSRTADATDVLIAAAGVGVGVHLGTRGASTPEAGAVRLWPLAAVAAWLLVVAARHWSPFDFVADGAFMRKRLSLMLQLPFTSYYWGNPLVAFSEVMTKVLLAVPVGALFQLVWLPRTARWRTLQFLAIAVLSAGIFLVVEIGQLMLPTRIPDQTDIYIGVAGAVLGAGLIRLVSRGSEASQSTLRGDS